MATMYYVYSHKFTWLLCITYVYSHMVYLCIISLDQNKLTLCSDCFFPEHQIHYLCYFTNWTSMDWRDDLEAKKASCSCRVPKSDFQNCILGLTSTCSSNLTWSPLLVSKNTSTHMYIPKYRCTHIHIISKISLKK